MRLLCHAFPNSLLLPSGAALALHHARAAVLCSRTLSLSGDPGWLPAVCILLDLCFGLDIGWVCRGVTFCCHLACRRSPRQFLSFQHVFPVEKCEHIQAVICEVSGDAEVSVDSHLGILDSGSLTIANTAL